MCFRFLKMNLLFFNIKYDSQNVNVCFLNFNWKWCRTTCSYCIMTRVIWLITFVKDSTKITFSSSFRWYFTRISFLAKYQRKSNRNIDIWGRYCVKTMKTFISLKIYIETHFLKNLSSWVKLTLFLEYWNTEHHPQ